MNSHSIKQFANRPRLFTPPNSRMVGGAVIRNAGTVLKQLAQRERVAANSLVQAAKAQRDQFQSRCGQRCLGEAPPWDDRSIGVDN